MKKIMGLLGALYSPAGRVSVKRFLIVFCLLLVPIILLAAINARIYGDTNSESIFFNISVAYFIFCMFPIQLINVIKRLHDSDRSGWWWFIAFVPLAGPLVLLYFLLITGGAVGPNKYGEKPAW